MPPIFTGTDAFGKATLQHPWDDGTNSLENAENRLCNAFDFMSKLGVPFWTYHDRLYNEFQFLFKNY